MNKQHLIKLLTTSVFTVAGFISVSTAQAIPVFPTDLNGIQITNACVDFSDRCSNLSYYSDNKFALGTGTSATVVDPGVEFSTNNVFGSSSYPAYIRADFAGDTLHIEYQVSSTSFAGMELLFNLENMVIQGALMTANTLQMGAAPISFSGNQLLINVASQSINYETLYVDFQIQAVSAVPVPAAFWLFGSGLLGLVGIARRKKV